MENIIDLLQTFGIPALIGGAIFKYFQTMFKKIMSELKSLKAGTQATLRAQMISEYNQWNDKHYAPIWARQNFENCWKHYHALGENGVMDDIHEKFLALPTEPEEEV